MLKYADNFRSKKGQRAIDSRMALGDLLLKPAYKALSNEEIAKEIAMNPYLQYFLGLQIRTKRSHYTPASANVPKVREKSTQWKENIKPTTITS